MLKLISLLDKRRRFLSTEHNEVIKEIRSVLAYITMRFAVLLAAFYQRGKAKAMTLPVSVCGLILAKIGT